MADNPEKILIGIISKNRADILPMAIQSALAQRNVEISVAVYDDNSTDNTRLLAKRFPQVEWHFSEFDLGYVFGRNKLMTETDAQFYCSLDDDSWFLSESELKIALDTFNSDPNIAAIAFDILSPDRPHTLPIAKPIETNMFIGCGHVLRLSAVKEVGFYEPNPGFYGGEEIDLCIRLIDKGYKIVKLPGIHVWHDKTMVSRDVKRQIRSGVCNDMVFAFRRIPGMKVWPILLLKALSHLRFSLLNNKMKFLSSSINGLKDFATLLVRKEIRRKPVSNAAYKKYFFFGK